MDHPAKETGGFRDSGQSRNSPPRFPNQRGRQKDYFFFFAAVFLAVVFLAVVFLAVAFLAVAFLAVVFLAVVFLAVVFFFAVAMSASIDDGF